MKRLRVEEDELATKVSHLEKLLEIVTPALKSLAGGGSNSNAVSSAVSTSGTSNSTVTVGEKEGSIHDDFVVGNSNNSSVNSNATTNATTLVPSIHDNSVQNDSQGNLIGCRPENDLCNNTSSSIDTTIATTNATANATTTNTTINTTSPSNNKDNNKKGAHKKDKTIEISNSGSSSGSGTSNSTTTSGGGGDSTSVVHNKPAQPPIRRAVVGPSFRPSKRDDAPVVGSGRTLEGGDIVWVPPTTQSGDGKTSLNSKYGY